MLHPRSGAAAVLVAAAVAGGIGAFGPASASATVSQGRIEPKQHFTATVNGHTGHPNRVTIWMACFGPIRPGQTGHPFKGQTVAVTHVRLGGTNVGYTGPRGNSIGAFFGAPPPAAPSSSSPSYILFKSYGRLPIPTSMNLPCAGSGTVSFVPLPLNPGSQDVPVPVSFVGQP